MALPQSAQRKRTIPITAGQVEDLSSDGHGTARLNSKTVSIEGALPGEDVDLEAVHHHRDYLAKIAGKVVEIEGSNGSVARVLANKAYDDSKSIRFYQDGLFQDQVHAMRLRRVYDHLLLDPTPAGARGILACMGDKLPARIVYISCHPTTLVRDAGFLANERKYKLLSARVVDMFPHSAHVEYMAVFARDGSQK